MATGYGYRDCVVCGAKEAMLESAETHQPSRMLSCSNCGYCEEHIEGASLIGFRCQNDEPLNPEMFRRVADLMDKELEKVQTKAVQDEPPKTNVICFANDLASPKKWEACKTFIGDLDKREVYQQVENVLKSLHLENVASYWACGDAKARYRLGDILRELERRLGQHLFKVNFAKTLERNQNVWNRDVDKDDALRRYTDHRSPEYDSEFTAAVKTIETV